MLIYPLFDCEVTRDQILHALEEQYVSYVTIGVDEHEKKIIEQIKGKDEYCRYELFPLLGTNAWEFVIGIREEYERSGGTVYDFAIKLLAQDETELVNYILINCGIGTKGEYVERNELWKDKKVIGFCVERAKKVLALNDLDEAANLLRSQDFEELLPLDFECDSTSWTVHFEERIKLSGELSDGERDRLQNLLHADHYVPANHWDKSMKNAGIKLLNQEIKRLESF